MLVTFRTEAHADILMFGDIAIQLLELMGHSGTVPGALLADEVPAALDRLRNAVATHPAAVSKAAETVEDDDDRERAPGRLGASRLTADRIVGGRRNGEMRRAVGSIVTVRAGRPNDLVLMGC